MSKKIYDPFPGKPGSGYPWLRAKALRCFATPYGAITIPKGGGLKYSGFYKLFP